MTFPIDRFSSISCPDSLNPYVQKLSANPSIQDILNQVGKIKIVLSDCNGRNGLWSWKERTIKIDPKQLKNSEANTIATIVFELCNALQTPRFERMIAKEPNVEDFVRSFEKTEYHSAQLTKELVPQIIGKEADFDFQHISPNFTLHYALNQIDGHSEWIAKAYFPTQSYRGTLHHPLSDLNQYARELLYSLLYCQIRGTTLLLTGESTPIGFTQIMCALKASSKTDLTAKKVLECAKDLFPELNS